MRSWAERTVVIGGHSRNIGKTGVMAGLIYGLAPLGWTAVKITQYGHGICSLDGEPCGCAPSEHSYVLTEENDPEGRSDTCRFLAAGARRSLWLRVRQGQLAEAFPALEEWLDRSGWVMVESNSILELIDPRVYIAVMDSATRDFKASARKFLGRADAFVLTGSRFNARAWPEIGPQTLEGKPRFAVSSNRFHSEKLCRFVRQKLGPARAEAPAGPLSRAPGQKEHLWRH
ncbi:MAG TPA: hypothetical protein VFM21_07170 [Terriglobia bacterium]|nr:hypothetical protein [Terriglobia bacterium]